MCKGHDCYFFHSFVLDMTFQKSKSIFQLHVPFECDEEVDQAEVAECTENKRLYIKAYLLNKNNEDFDESCE